MSSASNSFELLRSGTLLEFARPLIEGAAADGLRGELELEDDLWGEVFEPLRDPALFAQVALDEGGAPCWPNGADLAPDAAYLEIKRIDRGGAVQP